ncbi:hypothetical protein K6119_13475 [Paracrocinitomix mangrovi]|uniref:RHS repeat domain-containing protein n=1 Tax=Paracrocinitomix mangrovi TaxID=2862509 RepID=UPI001C8DBE8F|nr:hypothetical protein [Paracrocinitomix mangrovi]UKN00742.1 hypothetical protein K6119_13475 [Paracrocinitomix mangrovi]
MKALFIICILIPIIGNGQLLQNQRGEIFGEMPFFNPDFVKKQNLKSFKGSYSTKYDHDIIRPNNDEFVYEFDKLGQLVRKIKIHRNDTLISAYQYDYKGNVIIYRESNKLGYYEQRYTYDNFDRMTSMEIRRDKENNMNKLTFELDESKVVAKERYEYIALEDKDYKKVCYNGSDRVFRTEFYYFNTDGKLAKIESALFNGTGRTEQNYFYDEEGRLEEISTISKASKTHTKKTIFTYDELGNVLSRHVYRNDKLIAEDQLVYFADSKLLKAVINRENENPMLTILQFTDFRNF